jgi:Na+-driven multidrug efflux pump
MDEIISLMGAEGDLHHDSVLYGRIEAVALPFFVLQLEFQSFFITAEKPKLGLITTLVAGILNMLLDALLVWIFPFGLIGAAVATALSQVVVGIIPIVYFFLPNNSLLSFKRPKWDIKALIKTGTNGCSELLNNVSMSLVCMLYNIQLLKFAGENGVLAYGVMTYVNMIFISVFIGYSIGTAPIISFHFGANNPKELKSLLIKSSVIIGAFSVGMLALALILNYPLAYMFVGYDKELLSLTVKGFVIYAFSFLFSGVAIFFSSFFTALNDGATSAFIAFMRTIVFQISAVMLLPLIFDIDGIWASVVVAEVLAVVVGFICLMIKRKKLQLPK